MTLKEELSLSRKKALDDQAKLDAQADAEMRKMIPKYIEPILRLMHEKYPFEKKLSIRVEGRGAIWFVPMLDISLRKYREYYDPELLDHQLLPAALRVGSEFDIDVQPATDKPKYAYIFTMTLDD